LAIGFLKEKWFVFRILNMQFSTY